MRKSVFHGVVGAAAMLTIATFWTSTLVSELFLGHGAVVAVKYAIAHYGLITLVLLMASTGASGFAFSKGRAGRLVERKKKRMPVLALNAALVMIPSALFLNHRAGLGECGATFYAVQVLELAVGLVQLTLLGMSFRDGLTLTGRLRTKAGAASRSQALTLALESVTAQTTDAKTLRFALPPGQQIAARPGQFLTFECMIDGKPVTRSYSICSSPHQKGYIEITPKRVENGCASQFLNDRATVGLTVKARGPYGKFCFDEMKHQQIVLIAGGSGITPLMSMLRYIDDLRIPAEATLIYCVRTERDIFFRDDLADLERRLNGFHYVPVLSQPGPEWAGWKGRLRNEILEREVKNPAQSTFFLCGPPAFMDVARSLLKEMRVESSRILQESFGGTVARATDTSPTVGSLDMKLARSAVTYKVSGEETVLESLERNGVMIPTGCRQGECGTCAHRLLAGKVKMEAEGGLNEELRLRGFILPCVSRPLGDITLEA